jgi:hypothetical protein
LASIKSRIVAVILSFSFSSFHATSLENRLTRVVAT